MKVNVLLAALTLLNGLIPSVVSAQDLSSMTSEDLAHGERVYRARCARCHGLDGLGGEGPALARPYLNYARDDEMLVSVIKNGIPGTGMPSDWSLMDLEARQTAAYVRSIGRVAVARPPPGDPVRGGVLYRGKGECGTCHGPNGTGNAFGPDLTGVAARRSAEFIREAIVDPGATLPMGLTGIMEYGFREYLPVRAKANSEDQALRGHRINESTFTILVRDQDGGLHSFQKSELAELTKQFGSSLMPAYGRRFTDEELDHLVAYLFSLQEVIP